MSGVSPLNDKRETGGMAAIMMRNTIRGILGLVLTAVATWLANLLVEKIFGPEEPAPAKR